MRRSKVKTLFSSEELDRTVRVSGWVRSKRGNKYVNFIQLNDGSNMNGIQVVADVDKFDETLLNDITTGAALDLTGKLVASQGRGQSVEIQAESLTILGKADAEAYPLQKKKHSLEFLREIAHLRPRTNTFGAVFRVRHALSFAVHKFFHEQGFYYLNTPVITGSDAEGAGQLFKVTTLDIGNPPKTEDGDVNFEEDFFGKSTNLTVSGQLEAELGAMALGQVYTFGPTFRAENSNTTRHLAEFWMIEPEVAFADLTDNMDLAEDLLKYCIRFALENCAEEIDFLNDKYDQALKERLNFVIENEFERITYTEAIEIIRNSKPYKKKKFEYLIEWGDDMQSEHERFLVEKKFERPVIVTDYPKGIKAFYMRQNEDDKTVAAMDVLFPQIGEIVGGSQREERLDRLEQRIEEMEIDKDHVWWYLETRKYGTAPHSGFGLGFERLVQFVTGMGNIRDVIPFPRTPKNAEF